MSKNMNYNFSNINDTYIKKEYILEKVTEEEIFSYYLNTTLNLNIYYKSPFTPDKNPSMRLYYRDGSLKFKDFSSGEGGNCFDLVARICGLPNLPQVTERIKRDLIDKKGSRLPSETKISKLDVEENSYEISCIIRDFEKYDFDYWNQFGITKEFLDKYNIKACEQVWEKSFGKDSIFYLNNKKNPCYRYIFNNKVKVYCPLATDKTKKFRSMCDNYKDVQGLKFLDKNGGENLILTSSYKDVIVTNEYWNIPSIAAHGEGHYLDERTLTWIKANFKNICIFYNTDEPGFKASNAHSEVYDLPTMYIPIKYGVTDQTDFIKKYGVDRFIDLKEEVLSTIKY